jgi:hypothetical protein
MSILNSLRRITPAKFYPQLGHRPYWQYTIGSYSGSELWNTSFVIVTDAVSEPTVITAKRKKAISGRDIEVLALPDHGALTHELAQAMCNIAGGYCTLRFVRIEGGQQQVGAEACIVGSNGAVEWKPGYLHDALHAVPRKAETADPVEGEQLDLAGEVVSLAGLA